MHDDGSRGPALIVSEGRARDILLVRAIESRGVVGPEDSLAATRAGERQAAAQDGSDAAFLHGRAAWMRERLERDHPHIARVLAALRWRHAYVVIVAVIAFVVGLLVDELGPSHRINIVSFPLLAMLAWNAVVYALLLAHAVRSAPAGEAHPLRASLRSLARRAGERASEAAGPLAAGLSAFVHDWLRACEPILVMRSARLMHTGAALLATGVVAGMYVRGIAFQYLAGWESTFLDAQQLARGLHWVLGPASALTGIGLPGAEALDALRMPGGTPGTAAPWIHLYAATAALFIILPRAILAAWAGWCERRMRLAFPIRTDDEYFGRLLRDRGGEAIAADVVTYGAVLGAPMRAALERWVREHLGARVHVQTVESVQYGEEDEWLAARPAADARELLLLFSLASTPEDDSHGVLMEGLRRLARDGHLHVLVDESGYRRRFDSHSARFAERRRLWEGWLRGHDVPAVLLDLDAAADAERALPQ